MHVLKTRLRCLAGNVTKKLKKHSTFLALDSALPSSITMPAASSVSSGSEDIADTDDVASNLSDWVDELGDEDLCFTCLFSDAVCDSLEEAVRVDRELGGFDLFDYIKRLGLSFYDVIQLINYVRSQRAKGEDPRDELSSISTSGDVCGEFPWRDEAYLVPVLEGDAMLAYDWDELDGDGAAVNEEVFTESLREVMGGLDLNDPAVVEVLAAGALHHQSGSGAGGSGGDGSNKTSQPQQTCVVFDKASADDIDSCYFSSYSTFDIHKEMLQDVVRTSAYRDALEKNQSLVKSARVLDVGCGTGVLSMFAARGGAAKVTGVDGSPQIAAVAKDLCARNGFSEEQVQIVSSKVEDLADIGEVDVLVSEWMGYALLFESMLDSVLVARDRFLRKGGAILPDVANMYVALGSAEAEGLGFWDDVYGLNMAAIGGALRDQGMRQTIIRVAEPSSILSEGIKFHSLDLATMTRGEQDFSSQSFELFPLEEHRKNGTKCSCLVVWFDTEFSSRFCSETPVVLDTSPMGKATHWAQTVLPLKDQIELSDCDAIKGRISMSRQETVHRTLDISVEYRCVLGGVEGPLVTQLYSIGVRD